MNRPVRARRGFTLIELLLVIAIILILAAASFGLFRAASNARSKSVARGAIQAISMAAESYRKTYGDYPVASPGTAATNGPRFRQDLYDQLSGRKVLRQSAATGGGTAVNLVPFDDASLPGGTNRKPKPFLGIGAVETNNDAAAGDRSVLLHFVDPWGNPFDYRYRVLIGGTTAIQNQSTGAFNGVYGNWKTSGYLLVSCGINYVDPAGGEPAAAEYWDPAGAMTANGVVPASYFEDGTNGPYRTDNIVNWAN
ncbi:MAG: prepilin-type N-terminal cleavage/methylation domain-containing protein [Opitutales bacterium]